MKRIISFTILVFTVRTLFSQTTPEEYLKKVPALSNDTCNVTKTAVLEFGDMVRALNDMIVGEMDVRKELLDDKTAENEDAYKEGALKQMSQQYGLSEEDMAKIKNGKELSQAEKQALANKMMLQQTNISMEEAKKLSKMSEAGRKAWAEAYATEAMAAAQANQGKQTVSGNPGQTLAALIQSQNAIARKLSAGEQQIMAKYQKLENDPSGKIMLDKISAWKSQWSSMSGVDYGQGAKMDSLALLIKKEEIKYCRMFTPQLWKILNEHSSFVQSSFADYRILEETTSQIMKVQTGLESPVTGTDIECLKAIHNYLDHLQEAYVFKLYYPGEN